MATELPARPHLDHLKKQSRQLLSAYRAGDAAAQSKFRTHLPAYDSASAPALHDAQSVVARMYGFPSWANLRAEVRLRVTLPHGEPDRTILVPAAGEKVRPADRHINRIAFAPDGETLVSAGMDGRIRTWGLADGAMERNVQALPKSGNTLSFSPDGTLLITGCTDGTARVWSWPALEEVATLPPRKGAAAWFAPLGARVVAIAANGRPGIYAWPGGERIAEVRAHPKKPAGITFTPDGETLVSYGLEGAVAFTRLDDGETVDVQPLADTPILGFRYVPGTDRILLAEYGGRMRLLDDALHTVAETDIGKAGQYTIAFHPSEDVFGMCVGRGIQLRRNADAQLLGTLDIPAKGVYTLAFSPDDGWLAAAGADQRIRWWRMAGPA